MATGLTAGFMLDRQWHWMRGEMDQTKRPVLLALCGILTEARVDYAIIGGLAVQVHHPDPRTTLDIDVAILDRSAIPREALEAAGIHYRGSFEHSENWLAADGTPVRFSDDPELFGAVRGATEIAIESVSIRVIRIEALLREKLRAGSDPARRRSKRLQDLADVAALLEIRPDLEATLTAGERALLDRLPG